MAYDNSDPNLVGLFLDEGEEEFDVDAYDEEKKRRKLMEELLSGGIEPDEEVDADLLADLDLEGGDKPKLRHLKGVETEAEKEGKYGRIDEQAPGEIELQERHELFREDPFEPDLDDLGLSEEAEESVEDLMKEDEDDTEDKKITIQSKKAVVKPAKGDKKGLDKNKPIKISKTEVAGEEIPEDPFEKMARESGKRMTSEEDRPVYEDKWGMPGEEPGIEEDEITGGLLDLATMGGAGLARAGIKGLGRLLGRAGAREAVGEGVGAAASRSAPKLRLDMSRAPTGDDMVRGLFERNARRAAEAGGPDSMAIRGAQNAGRGKLRLQYRDATNEVGSESSDAARRFGGFGTMNRSDAMRAAKRIVDQVKKLPHGRVNRQSIETQLRNLGLSEREIMQIFPQ